MISNGVVHRPFFTLPQFFPSPKKSYVLPSYAEALASTFASTQNFPMHEKLSSLDPLVMQFVDATALESDTESSSTTSNGHSQSMSTFSM
jgi:hypothetical protein